MLQAIEFFTKSRSKVKVIRPFFYDKKALISRKMHVKYEDSKSNSSKVIGKINFFKNRSKVKFKVICFILKSKSR